MPKVGDRVRVVLYQSTPYDGVIVPGEATTSTGARWVRVRPDPGYGGVERPRARWAMERQCVPLRSNADLHQLEPTAEG
jgi:hypothetical protein